MCSGRSTWAWEDGEGRATELDVGATIANPATLGSEAAARSVSTIVFCIEYSTPLMMSSPLGSDEKDEKVRGDVCGQD